jgi:hypothetical protein
MKEFRHRQAFWHDVMRRIIRKLLKDTPLEAPARYALTLAQSMRSGRSQSNEKEILFELTRRIVVPNTFVEFDFHWREFNCIGLKRKFPGLLIDGSSETVSLARRLLPRTILVSSRNTAVVDLSASCRSTSTATTIGFSGGCYQ